MYIGINSVNLYVDKDSGLEIYWKNPVTNLIEIGWKDPFVNYIFEETF